MRRHLRRLRLCGSIVSALLAPAAYAQTPVPPQGISPPTPPRAAVSTIQRASFAPEKPAAPGLLSAADSAKPSLAVTVKPAPPAEKLTPFDPNAAEIRRDGKHWQLWAGKTLLKDFGDNGKDAFEARRLVAELKLSEHGAIGTPATVMEYWLSDGHAPPLPGFSRQTMPFDPSSLRVQEDRGAFYLRDAGHVLFNFGPHADDAKRALAVIQKYGFNEVGLVGGPQPTMTYLLKSDKAARATGDTLKPQMLPQQAPRFALDLPGLGRVGEFRPFDPLRLDVQHGVGGWHLMSNTIDLGVAGGSEYAARTSMQIAQRYPFTEYVRVGSGEFGFYLSHFAAPRGVPPGVRRQPFDAKTLAVKQTGEKWAVADGRQTLATFSSADEAKLAVQVIRHYGFNCVCDVGSGLHFLAQDR